MRRTTGTRGSNFLTLEFQGPSGPFEILAPVGGFLHSYEEDGGNMGRGANLYIKHELIDCIPVYHALYSHFDTFELIERNSY